MKKTKKMPVPAALKPITITRADGEEILRLLEHHLHMTEGDLEACGTGPVSRANNIKYGTQGRAREARAEIRKLNRLILAVERAFDRVGLTPRLVR